MIAFDIDGVVCNFTDDIFIPCAEELLGIKISNRHNDVEHWDYADSLGITPEEEASVWRSNLILEYMKSCPAIKSGIDIINNYLDKNIEVCFITSRGTSSKDEERNKEIISITEEWIDNIFGEKHSGLYFCRAEEKHIIASKLEVDLMYEDKPETILNLSNSDIITVVPVYRYNFDCCSDNKKNIIPVLGWIND